MPWKKHFVRSPHQGKPNKKALSFQAVLMWTSGWVLTLDALQNTHCEAGGTRAFSLFAASTRTTPLDPNAPSWAHVFYDSNVTVLSRATLSFYVEAWDLVPSVERERTVQKGEGGGTGTKCCALQSLRGQMSHQGRYSYTMNWTNTMFRKTQPKT